MSWSLKLTILIVSLAMPVCLMAANVAAKKDGVKVLSKAKKGSSVVTVLKKGDVLAASERKGMYWSVKFKGKSGYVSILKVRRKAGKPTGLAAAIRGSSKGGRITDDVSNQRSRSAVMGVRGLDESSETAFAGNAKPNLRMVYAMEDRGTTEAKVESLGDLVLSEIERKVDAGS